MGGKEQDVYSSCSSAISTPLQPRKHHLPRLSLHRLFHSHRTKRTKSKKLSTELNDTRSDTSVVSSVVVVNGGSIPKKQATLAEPEDVGIGDGDGEEKLECPVCLTEQPRVNFPEIGSCEHRSCLPCLQQYLKIGEHSLVKPTLN